VHVILWRFRARADRDAAFLAAYGEDGTWARFFRSGEGFLGSELMRGTGGAYLTIDRWASPEAAEAFRRANAARYAELDAACALLTAEETHLGDFDL